MGLYEIHYSEYIQNFCRAHIEADSKEEAIEKFQNFDYIRDGIFEDSIFDHCEIEQILKIE